MVPEIDYQKNLCEETKEIYSGYNNVQRSALSVLRKLELNEKF